MLSVNFCKFTHVLGLLVILLIPFAVSAQVSGGTISGKVTDTAGALIPGAAVAIRNTATGVTTNLVANEDAIYRASNLLAGDYEITASSPNFTSFLQKGVTLTVGADLTIDLKLTAGAVTASIMVSDEAPTVDTTTPTISAVVNERTIVELPLNGRDWTSLATLQPGISSIRTQYASGGTASRGNRGYGDELTITGHRPQENNYRIDGVSINDYTNGAPGSAGGVNLGADAVKEFSVLASNYTAEYGRTSGGVINAITRSGSNSIHGSAYEFFRNDALDAANFIDNENSRPKPPLRRNQFGGSVGGPIIKNQTFFFADYEAIRRTQGVPSVVNVLSLSARAGNLCSIPTGVTPNCTPTTVPVHPNISPFLNLYPRPNGPLLGNGDTAIFATSLTQKFTENFFTTRIDHRISSKDSLFGTYMFDNGSLSIPDALNNVVFPNRTRRQMIALEETHTFNQNFINSFRLGYNRTKGAVNVQGPALNPVAADTALGSAPGRASAIITVPGVNDAVGVGGNSFFRHVQNSYQIYDDAFVTRGNHSLRFGFAFEKIEYNELGLRRPNGRVRFRSVSDFLQDRPRDFFSLDPARTREVGVRSSIWAGYLNDSWRYSSRLNLNLGLRYEMSTIPKEAHDQFQAVLTPSGPVVSVKKLFNGNPTLRNFEPRVGFAYDIFGDGKTAFRGGFGVYDALPLPWIFAPKEAQGTPFNTGTTVSGLAQGSFPSAIFPSINFNTAPLDVPFTELNPSRNYIMNWNLTVQHRVVRDWTLTAAYVGSRGVHMAFGTDEINIVLPIAQTPQGLRWPTSAECTANPSLCSRLNPNASQVRGTFWDGNSHYNGLQLQILKPMAHSFQAQGSYTFSKCIDEGSEASRGDQFLNGITSPLFIEKAHRRGRCSYDLRHVFVGNMLWNIPGPKEGIASKLFGNWQLGSILSASSGVPFSVIISGDPLGLKGTDVNGWPDYVPGCKIENPSDHNRYINTQCFTLPNPITRLGNAGRNIATGPRLFNLDMAFYKNVPVSSVSEGFRVQLRAEFFNILNHTNFAPPLSNNAVFGESGAAIGAAGRITSTQTSSRQIQLGIRLNW